MTYAIFLNLLKLISLMHQDILDIYAKLKRPPCPYVASLLVWPPRKPKNKKDVLGDDPHMPPPPKKKVHTKNFTFSVLRTLYVI